MNGYFRAVADWIGGLFNKRIWSSTGGGRKTTSQEVVSEDSALNNAAVWAATRLLSGTGASLPFPLYSGSDDDTRTKERTHPVYKLLNGSPNPEMTAYNFRSIMWQWQINWGNAYAEIVREGNMPDGVPVALWPLHPDRVEPCRDESGVLYYKVRGEGGGVAVELESWQMLHIPSVLTFDGIVGQGVISRARESIGAGIAAEKYGAHWFGGGAVPRAVIMHNGKWNDEQRKEFAREWDEIYGGPDGRRMAVLQGGATVQQMSLSAEDSQFLDTQRLSVEVIARWYGVPPFLLQHLLNATMNNVEELGIGFVRYSLVPWLKVWEQCVWQKLLTPEEQTTMFAEHNVSALMRGDVEARKNFYQTMITLAVMNRNEARKMENLDPVPGGNTFLIQGAMVPLDEEGKPVSDFTGNTQQPNPQGNPQGGNPTALNVVNAVETRLKRIVSHDLSRFLTKETKAIASFAKKPKEFLSLLDGFYREHSPLVMDEMTETVGALLMCGVEVDVNGFVSDWVASGREMIVDASGNATPDDLPAVIQLALESRTWIERPIRAVEGIEACKRSVAICG